MIAGFTAYDQQLLEEFRRDDIRAQEILARFCEVKAAESRTACARYMAHVPREHEIAANFAAHAEVYDRLMRELLTE